MRAPSSPSSFLAEGTLSLGANYWASHAGTAMWRQWRPEVVRDDLERLASHGLGLLRVFPLWPDFQPVSLLRAARGEPAEFRHGEEPMPRPDGLSPAMLDRFGEFAALAEGAGVELIVGLVTGWMSGRLFVPPAFEGRNPLTDPEAIRWQVRFVRGFVERFRSAAAIRAWDLGNECNVMGRATPSEAYLWTAALCGTIRAADPGRPVISGMHSLTVGPGEGWTIADQGELTDILTTHPYPLFTPHCHREPLDTMRPLLHASAETRLYADLAGRPAMVEEFGSLGPMICDDDVAGAFARVRLYDIWAHDGRAALWWCAHDQTGLTGAPYDWHALERELGLLRADGSAKPALREFGAFREAVAALPFGGLPLRRAEAVCLLTPGQDHWGVAYSAFVLAKQAGFDVRFHEAERETELPEAALYLVPSMRGAVALSRRREDALWERVAAGATAYLSLDEGCYLGRFAEATGLRLKARSERRGECAFGGDGLPSLSLPAPSRFRLVPERAVVLAAEEDGNPALSRAPLGRGQVFCLTVPLEAALARAAEAFLPGRPDCWKLYRRVAEAAMEARWLRKNSPWLGITEHPLPSGGIVAVVLNYLPEPVQDELTLRRPGAIVKTWIGAPPESTADGAYRVLLPPHAALVFRIEAVS